MLQYLPGVFVSVSLLAIGAAITSPFLIALGFLGLALTPVLTNSFLGGAPVMVVHRHRGPPPPGPFMQGPPPPPLTFVHPLRRVVQGPGTGGLTHVRHVNNSMAPSAVFSNGPPKPPPVRFPPSNPFGTSSDPVTSAEMRRATSISRAAHPISMAHGGPPRRRR